MSDYVKIKKNTHAYKDPATGGYVSYDMIVDSMTGQKISELAEDLKNMNAQLKQISPSPNLWTGTTYDGNKAESKERIPVENKKSYTLWLDRKNTGLTRVAVTFYGKQYMEFMGEPTYTNTRVLSSISGQVNKELGITANEGDHIVQYITVQFNPNDVDGQTVMLTQGYTKPTFYYQGDPLTYLGNSINTLLKQLG